MRKKRISLGVTIALMALSATLTMTLTYQYAMTRFNEQVKNVTERQKMYAKLYQIDTRAREKYLYDIDENRLYDAIADGYVNGLTDPHSEYLTQAECTTLQKQLAGTAVGIGAEITIDSTERVVVSRVIKGAPAEVAGIVKGDTVTQIDGVSVDGLTIEQIQAAISGDAGAEVLVTVQRLNELDEYEDHTVTITRKEYNMVTVESRVLSSGLGYIRIYTFNETTDEEFEEALTQLSREAVSGLIVDVRNNGGGTLESAANILDMLLPAGSIVSSAGADGKKTVLHTSDKAQNELPLAVLINEKSASAAELMAAAVQDYQRGTVVGMQSFGKGTLQELFSFTDGSGLYLTTAYFYPPLSANFEGVGVTPNVKVEFAYTGNLDLLTEMSDTQLNAAITMLLQTVGNQQPENNTSSQAQTNSAQSNTASSVKNAVGYERGCEDYGRI